MTTQDLFKTKKSTREHLVNLTKELVRFPSHPGEPLKIFELVEFIKTYFAKDDLPISEHMVEGLPALVITTEPTKHPHIMLSGHIDVVASCTQFTATVKGDELWGSGTMDMKGGVACMMAALKYFVTRPESESRPSIGLMLTADEETGGEATRALLEDEGYMTDFCIVNEGRHKYDIVTREKGILVVKVTLDGPSMHSAYPWKGRNPLEALSRIILTMKDKFPKARDGWVPTMTVTSMRGGEEVNTIPGCAEAILNFRLTDDSDYSRERILKFLEKEVMGGEVKELIHGDVFQMDPKNEYLKLLRIAAQETTGGKITWGQNNGASDARFFMKKGIPTGILGPLGHNSHSPTEWVSINSLWEHFTVLKKFIAAEHEKSEAEKIEFEI